MTISGSGFTTVTNDIEVNICGTPSKILTASYNMITLNTPVLRSKGAR